MLEKDFLEAIVKGDSQRVVRLLGQITDTGPIKDGRNALHLAAQYGNSDIVSVLLLSGLYDCNTPDSIGYTAFQIAAAEGYLEIVKQLIKASSNVDSADNVHGNTALHEAAWKGYSRTVAEIAKTKADLNIKNWGGFTALHLCCQNGHNQSCRELLLAGCNPDVQNNYGDTPLHTSARYGHAGVMRVLISAQCHVSDQNKNGDTALHIAAAMNRRKLTRILLESNCDKTIVNKQNENAEEIAIRKSLKEILEILKNPITASKKTKNTSSNSKCTAKKVDKRANKVRLSSKKNVSSGNVAAPWSPYGCHYYPDSKEFPEPNLDSLPNEPLRKGEQYYLDLAGNIRKGPVGVGYTCYCAPFFHKLESRIEKKTKKIKKQIHRAEDAINKRLDTLEYCMSTQQPTKLKSDFKSIKYRNVQEGAVPNGSLYQTRSFESIFDASDNKNGKSNSNENVAQHLKVETKRKNVLYFPNKEKENLNKMHGSDCSSPCFRGDRKESSDLSNNRKKYSSSCLDSKMNINLWKTSKLAESDSCESTDEDCEKVTDIQCNDSGYSTKLCSNSQGPSPSLSGRLENDGLLSVTSSQEEKRIAEMNAYISSLQNISLKQASVV